MALDISSEECLQIIVVRAPLCGAVLGTFTRGHQRDSGLSLCKSGRLMQSGFVLVKAQFRRSCCAFCAPTRIRLSPCVVLSFFLHS